MQRKNITFIKRQSQRSTNVDGIQRKNITLIKRQSQRSTNVDTTLLYNVKMTPWRTLTSNVQPTLTQRLWLLSKKDNVVGTLY